MTDKHCNQFWAYSLSDTSPFIITSNLRMKFKTEGQSVYSLPPSLHFTEKVSVQFTFQPQF